MITLTNETIFMVDFPKKRESQSNEESPSRATHIVKKNQSLFHTLKTFAKNLLLPPDETKRKIDAKLKGRIQGLQQAAYQVVSELTAIKDDLENQADPDLVHTIESVVNHIIRDVMRIEKTASNLLSPEEQLDTAERYSPAKRIAIQSSRLLSNTPSTPQKKPSSGISR